MSQSTKKVPLLKPKFGSRFGFGAPSGQRASAQAGKGGPSVVKFDPARFKTQHKG